MARKVTKEDFKEILQSIVSEIMDGEDDLIEMTVTDNIEGYQTPFAFSGNKGRKKKKRISTNSTGYTIYGESVINGSLKKLLFTEEEGKNKGTDKSSEENTGGDKEEREKHSPGDVWQRKGGEWAGKNSKGSIQGYKEKESAERWAGDKSKSDEKDDKKPTGGDDKPTDDKPTDDKPKKGGGKPPKKKGSSMKDLFKGSSKYLSTSPYDDLESAIEKQKKDGIKK